MKIAINGTGVAGPTLAWWLQRYGYQSVLFEKAPVLRTGGYVIDFWGIGYAIAEKMGILPQLQEKGYLFNELRIVDGDGGKIAGMNVAEIRSLADGRFLSIARGDIAATLYHACQDASPSVETRFGTHITGVVQDDGGVTAHLSDGSAERFDLVIGADGLHSHIRSLVFGPEEQFEHSLGVSVAACTLSGYRPREEQVYVTYPESKKQIARASLRDDRTLFLFTFRSELASQRPTTTAEARQVLRDVFGDMGWEAPSILARLDEADDLYFDSVSQIRMDRWSQERVALIGDAAACASLLAGEGTGLAMAEAYVLAGELHRAGGDYIQAFQKYEQRLQSFLKKKQQAALNMVTFFAPKDRLQMAVVRLALGATSIPYLSKLFVGQTLQDDIELPEYVLPPAGVFSGPK